MVELKGSEKQVKWAEDIKKKELEILYKYQTVQTGNREIAIAWRGDKVIETEIEEVYSPEKFEVAKENLRNLISLLENESDAKFIIENRENLRLSLTAKYDVKYPVNKFRKFFEEDVVKINF